MTTTSERFLLAAAISPAILAFGYAWPVRAVLSQVEVASAFGLAASGLLFAIGVSMIVDWRRKRRATEPDHLMWTQHHAGWVNCEIVEEGGVARMVPIAAGALSTGFTDIDPLDELERHLTDALAVLLREPHLRIDASTVRMLTKFKDRRPVVRDEKGRWRSVQ